ncbi:MAG: Sec-independent protein translocase protein TatB [Rickettsiales bacterium]|nr:Sec-independent protein translocase protein TatB [Rickettsiales bacterium]
MLDIGFSELLLIAVVALIVIGPKDLPAVIRHGAKFLREMREVYAGLKRQMTEVMDEVGVNDIKREMTTIIDLEGKPQQAFDVKELEALKQSPVASHQSPVASKDAAGTVVPSDKP